METLAVLNLTQHPTFLKNFCSLTVILDISQIYPVKKSDVSVIRDVPYWNEHVVQIMWNLTTGIKIFHANSTAYFLLYYKFCFTVSSKITPRIAKSYLIGTHLINFTLLNKKSNTADQFTNVCLTYA